MGRVTRSWLDNGMEWIHERDSSASGFYASFTARTGWEKERKREREGMHLIEHCFFRGSSLSDTLSRNRRLGDRGISSTGATSEIYCYTRFYGPTAKARDVVSAAHYALTHPFSLEEFELERDTLVEELLERKGESVWTGIHELMLKELYGDTRYGTTYDALIEGLPRLSLHAVESLRQRAFRPSNMSLITLGRLHDDLVRPMLERTFGQLTPTARSIEPYTCALPGRHEFRKEISSEGLPTCFVQHTMRCGKLDLKQPDPAQLATQYLLATVLGLSDTSLLYEGMRVKRGKAYSPLVSTEVGRPENLLHINYATRPTHLEQNIEVVLRSLEQLSSRRLPAHEFHRYQHDAVNIFRWDMTGEENRCDWYVQNCASGIFLREHEFRKLLTGVSAEALRDAARRWRDGMGTVIFKPV